MVRSAMMHHANQPDLLLRIACGVTGADALPVAEREG